MTKKMQQNLIAMGLFLAGTIFVYYQYLLSPLGLKTTEARNRLQQAETKLNDTRRRALELPKLQAEMKQLEQEVTDLESLLPKDKEIPSLLKTITKTAQQHHLRVSNFIPSGQSAHPNYNELPFQMTLQGTYHALAQFLTALGKEPRILNVRNLTLIANQPSRENPSTANVTFTLVAYTYKG